MTSVVIVGEFGAESCALASLAGRLDGVTDVRRFEHPANALDWAATNNPGLVIVDCRVPGLEDTAFINDFRQMPECAEVPVLAVTPYEFTRNRKRLLEAGASDLLFTPVARDEFHARANNLIQLNRQLTLLKHRTAQLQENQNRGDLQTRAAHRQGEEILHAVINAIPAMISATDADHRYVFVNNFHAWSLGIDPAEAVGRTVEELMGTAYGLRARNRDRQVFETGMALAGYEENFTDASGLRRTLVTTKSPIRNAEGSVASVVTTAIDIGDPKSADHRLAEQHDFLRAVIDLNPNFIFATDQSGRIGLANRAFSEAYGTTPENLLGAEHAEFSASNSEVRELLDEIHRVMDKSLRRLDVERLFTQSTGEQSWLRISHVPLNHSGEPMVLTVGTDVSALKQAEQAMREAKHQAELSDPSKSGFLANMSHELRTPLNAILGFSEMIAEQMLGPISVPRYREYARDISTSAMRLLEVIDDILDLSHIETGKIELHEEEVFLRDAAATVERLVTEHAKAEEITLRIRIRHDLPALRADPQRIKQVLLNLISNAIKFTPRGGAISVTADMDAAGGLRIAIADTGIGMDEAEIPLALWRFSQIDSALTRSYSGTGLGLPLSDAFLQLHQATLDISSIKDVGTTAIIHFPPERTVRRILSAAG